MDMCECMSEGALGIPYTHIFRVKERLDGPSVIYLADRGVDPRFPPATTTGQKVGSCPWENPPTEKSVADCDVGCRLFDRDTNLAVHMKGDVAR